MEARRKRELFSLAVAVSFVLFIVAYNYAASGLAGFTGSVPVGQVIGENLTRRINGPPENSVKVSFVIDGESFQLETGERVVLLGINAPKPGQSLYEESTARLKDMLEGKYVILEKDVTDTDEYGRMLRYVFVNGILANLEMIREGYANIQLGNDMKYVDLLLKGRNEARDLKKNIWQIEGGCAFCIQLSGFKYNASADKEYVRLTNICEFPCGISNWVLSDIGNTMYVFPPFRLEPDESVVVHTGTGTDTLTDLYWNREWDVWNDDGDSLYLRDSAGTLILSYDY